MTPLNWFTVQHEKKWEILGHQKRFAFWVLYSSIGSMMLGFDWGISGTATAMPAFQQQMGIPWPDSESGYLIPARIQSGWAGALSAGEVVGVLLAGYVLNLVGRKHSIALSAMIAVVGISMQVASKEWKLFLVGRLVNSLGFSIAYIQSPVWIGENSRPELRGFFLCITNTSIVLGQLIQSVVTRGVETIDGKWSYQTLVVLQYLYCALLLVGYPFFPESPYYLLHKGKPENARQALIRVHGLGDEDLINAEIERLQTAIDVNVSLDAAQKEGGFLIVQCFRGKNLKRTLIAVMPAAAQHLIGGAFVFSYITYFLGLLKIQENFTVSVVLYVVMLLSTISAFGLIEVVGRRPLLVWGMAFLAFVQILMGIMGCITSSAAIWVILVCMFLWAIVYQLTIGAVGLAIGAELPSVLLRATTVSIVGFTTSIFGWLIGFISPYMINTDAGNLGAKVGFVFGSCGVPLFILFYFFVPETKGLSFDEMDHLFAENVSPRHFQGAVKSHRDRIIYGEEAKDEIQSTAAKQSDSTTDKSVPGKL